MILDDESHTQLFTPPGYAHGFCVLSEVADFEYKCAAHYRPDDGRGVLWNDPKASHRLADCGPHRLRGRPAEPDPGRLSRLAAMKVLVTGAAGQAGSKLVDLGTDNFQPIGLSRDDLDITDANAVARTIERWQPQTVVNCAAYTAVDRAESEQEAAHAVNVKAVAHLAAACANSGTALVHVSTDYVFDGSANAPYREEDPTAPLGVYGRGERAAASRHVILRVSWVFGTHGRSFVDTMLRLTRERPELAVVDDQIGALLRPKRLRKRSVPSAWPRRAGRTSGAPTTSVPSQ